MSSLAPSEELVLARLSLVDISSGSIVAIAAWVSMHASSADVILKVWSNLVTNPEADEETRIALLYLLHEVILSCHHRAVGDRGIKAILTAMAKRCPAAFTGAAANSSKVASGAAVTDFRVKLAQVLQWWGVMKVLPPWILKEMKGQCLGDEADQQALLAAAVASTGVGVGSHGSSANVPKPLHPLLKLYSKYTAAKDRHRAALQSGDQDAIADSSEELKRRIVSLIKHIDGEATSDSGSLLGTLRSEFDDLRESVGAGGGMATAEAGGTGGAGVSGDTAAGSGGVTGMRTAVVDPLADLFE